MRESLSTPLTNWGIDWLTEHRLRSLEDFNLPLSFELWNGRRIDLHPEPSVRVSLPRRSCFKHLFSTDFASLGEAYVEGHIDIDGDISEAIRAVESLSAREAFLPKRLSLALPTFKLPLRTRRTDAKAISHHYDVSNDFYKLWLDNEMIYSCAYFKTGTENIHQAQTQKLDHICRKLRLDSGDRLLDVGCGWGGLMIWAVKNYGVKAVGITISQKQYEYVRRRIVMEGLDDRCQVKLKDYRDLHDEGVFDKVVSVGMFEHVGIKNLGRYFHAMRGALRNGGTLLNHGITSRWMKNRGDSFGGSKFIDRYVFPDGELPHLNLAARRMEESGLEITDIESLRLHYVKTLQHWHRRLCEKKNEARALITDKLFRVWNVYMPGCAHAFSKDWVSVYQITATKGSHNSPSYYPLTREHIYNGNYTEGDQT